MTGSSPHHDPHRLGAHMGLPEGHDPTLTPASLGDQRVEAPTLGEQLSAYEEKQRLLDAQLEELDPVTAQGVYLLVATVAGIALAAVVALALGGIVWIL